MRIRDGLLAAGLGLLLAGCPDKDKQQTPEEPVDNTPKVEDVYQEPEVLEEPETTLEEKTEDQAEKPIVKYVDGPNGKIRYEMTGFYCTDANEKVGAIVTREDGAPVRAYVTRDKWGVSLALSQLDVFAEPNKILYAKDDNFKIYYNDDLRKFEKIPTDGVIEHFEYNVKGFVQCKEPKEGECAWKGPATCEQMTKLATDVQRIFTTYTKELLTTDLCPAELPGYDLDKL
jgi:hypothetical protein